MIDLKTLTIAKARTMLDSKEITVRDLADAYLENIKEKNDDIFAYIEVYDDIDAQVEAAQKMIDGDNVLPLTGIPIAIKDNILRKGNIASAASKILSNYTATYDSSVVSDLRSQGAVVLGRTNMDDSAMGSSTETSFYGNTKNPVDTSRVPGGSSGGSAAAVAMNGALIAFGSSTGGSIRQPCAFCGLVGLYPGYGEVSRHGLIAMGSSLDQIGPLGKTVADVEIAHNIIAHPDAMDATCLGQETRDKNRQEPRGKKVGVPRSMIEMDGLDPRVKENFQASLDRLTDAGYEVVDIDLPHLKYSLATYYILMPAEVSTNHNRLDGIRFGVRENGKDLEDTYKKTRYEGFGDEVRRRIMIGTYVLSAGYYDAYYNKAMQVRDLIKAEISDIFETVDYIATPTTPAPAWKFGEISDPVSMYLADIFTVPANVAQIPAISVPSGTTDDGLPLGLHIMAPQFCVDWLFTIGKDFEGGE